MRKSRICVPRCPRLCMVPSLGGFTYPDTVAGFLAGALSPPRCPRCVTKLPKLSFHEALHLIPWPLGLIAKPDTLAPCLLHRWGKNASLACDPYHVRSCPQHNTAKNFEWVHLHNYSSPAAIMLHSCGPLCNAERYCPAAAGLGIPPFPDKHRHPNPTARTHSESETQWTWQSQHSPCWRQSSSLPWRPRCRSWSAERPTLW